MRTLCLIPALVASAAEPAPPIRVVSKTVAELPAAHDTTQPESTFAAFVRAQAEGRADLRPLFATERHRHLPKDGLKGESEPKRSFLLGIRIEEVHQRNDFAAVVATVKPGQVMLSFLRLEAGRWVLLGSDDFLAVEPAREKAQASLLKMAKPPASSVKIADPDAHLAAFTKHLASAGKEPKAFLLEALAKHRVVGFGEVHNRVTSWDLLTCLVQDADFPKHTGTIYMELPRSGQALMDRFLANETLDVEPVREVLRSLFHDGWPCKDEVDFLATVWAVNHKLEPAKRLRVVLVDQPWEWAAVKTQADLAKLQFDRNSLMAEAILADLKASPDPRHALFQVGYLHLPCGLMVKGEPHRSAGQLLRTALGRDLFTVVQHSPVMGNRGGQLDGRVRRGLFDEAFAKAGNRPVAFSLAGSSFAKEPFDMAIDLRDLGGILGTAFDGYIFLGPLEQDRYSDVAPHFYTDVYAQEVDRRCRLMMGTGIQEADDLEGSDGKALEAGRRRWMGQPAFWVDKLGPMDAWRK